MVRPDRDEHAWERLCARKRDEIERDTRLLSTQQKPVSYTHLTLPTTPYV